MYKYDSGFNKNSDEAKSFTNLGVSHENFGKHIRTTISDLYLNTDDAKCIN